MFTYENCLRCSANLDLYGTYLFCPYCIDEMAAERAKEKEDQPVRYELKDVAKETVN